MKNYLAILGFVITSILFTSCKKSSIEQVYFLKAKVDGLWVTFEGAKFTISPNASNSSISDLHITAGTEQNNINIVMESAVNYGTGTFNTTDSIPYNMRIFLFKDDGNYLKIYGTDGPGTGAQPYYIVTISSMTATEIRGTISGNYLYDGYDAESIAVTEGEFVAVKNQ
jgi:hypothetical protein